MANGDNAQTLSDIIRGMQYAVGQAQETLQQQQYDMLTRWFDSATGKPHEVFVVLRDGKTVHVPIVTLMPPGMLAIDELEMDFSVRVASSEVKPARDGSGDDRASFNVFFSGSGGPDDGGSSVKIRMKFKAVDEPESAARVRELLCATIQPVEEGKK